VVGHVFGALQAAVQRLHRSESAIFVPELPVLRLHTPLATGADQLAATAAREAGFRVRALLPFAAGDYCKDFAEGSERAEFERQLAASEAVFALPGERDGGDDAYVMVGKAIIAAADVLVAVWDGHEEGGPGGTAHVVDIALRAGVPVIHILVDRDGMQIGPVLLLAGGDAFDPVGETLSGDAAYDALLRGALAPASPEEREQLAHYLAERERPSNWRIEYPLLLALLGVRRLTGKPWRQRTVEENVGADSGSGPAPDVLAYGWANILAVRYAQLFRSGHVTNYALSALAVLLALFGLVAPAAKPWLVAGELATIGLLYLNTRAGTRGDWHRRWLQYRYLAESLRPLSYLKRTGMAGPPFRDASQPHRLHRASAADWTRWYAAAVWRQMESPSGAMSHERMRALAAAALAEQVAPQARYHRVNAHQMHELDHRLHRIGNLLMGTVIVTCLVFLAGYELFHSWTIANTGLFVLLSAGLPAIGAAVFGLRGHGEHLLAASRSTSTVTALEINLARLERVGRLDDLVEELERTAANMIDDLNQWTLAYRERSLEIPG